MGRAKTSGRFAARYDVVILGGGMAGQTLARHLLLETGRSVLMIERLAELPPARQKVGESTVQLAGYYLSRVLDLEEHLLTRHFLKYNLRFCWPSAGRDNRGLEDYSQGFIRELSNVASYQLDRNVFEAELLRLNREDPRFALALGAEGIEVELTDGDADHRLAFRTEGGEHEVAAGWVVDTTGRNQVLARRLGLKRDSPVRHGSFFWWVDGLLDLERLTDRGRREVRLDPARSVLGHLPMWLSTNHFCGEGYWFWIIPLHGKTSLGLVYDRAVVDPAEVSSVAKATAWICARHPLLERDLPHRRVLAKGGFRDFSYDCARTVSENRWALAGEAGRFSDPLYSPGSDLIAIHNTLIVDAVETAHRGELAAKARRYEQVMRAVYGAYIPSYAESYDALGDPETFSLKYGWELAVYFACYVFPFINELLTDRRFLASWLRAFARLGPINAGMQRLLSGYYQWKKRTLAPPAEPIHFDFTTLGPLDCARGTFYRVGLGVEEARRVLDRQLGNLEELARFTAARVASVVLDEPEAITDRDFVAGIEPADLAFAPEEWRRRWAASSRSGEPWRWSFDPGVMDVFPTARRAVAGESGPAAGEQEAAAEAEAEPVGVAG